MKKKEKEEQLAAHLPGILQYHQTMLADGVRNKLLFETLQQTVSSETSFLDVGAGTGVWAILAAKLGAKRVVAIEIEETLIPIIYRHAQENGVAHKIEIIHGNVDDVRIRGKFDVIVSELFGHNALGEQTIKSFVSLRQRFLAPGGILIPQKLSMLIAPVHFEDSLQDLPADLPIKCDFLKFLKLNYSLNAGLSEREKIQFLAAPQQLLEIDFRTVEAAPSLENLSVNWEMEDVSQVNALAMFNCSTFTDEIRMDNFVSQSWGTVIYEIEPFDIKSGEIKFSITMDDKKSIWTVSLPSDPSVQAKTYSPTFALTRMKMAQQMTPHRRFKAPKTKEDVKADQKKTKTRQRSGSKHPQTDSARSQKKKAHSL